MLFIIIILIIALIISVINLLHKSELKKYFNYGNVIVFGSRGKGKDVLFNYITNTRKFYYSNIPYTNKHYELVKPKDLELGDNSFSKLINGEIDKVEWNFKECTDFFFSDAGIFLPSQYDSSLHKIYPSFGITYAICRHLGKHNIHCNSQNLERIWKTLREQADTYIKCLGVSKVIPFCLLVKYRIYDKYDSAKNDVRPIKKGLFKTESNIKVHFSNTGLIKESFIIVSKFKTKYDSRYFRKLFVKETKQVL